MTATLLEQLHDVLEKARRAGADAADAMMIDSTALSVSWRNGCLESLENAESCDLGLRVLIGKKQAIISTTDRRPETLNELVARAIAMARTAPEDEFCGLADALEITKSWPALELADDAAPTAEQLIAAAREAEEAALAVPGVTMCENADASTGRDRMALAATNGFAGHFARTGYSLSVSALAGEGTAMEQDSDYSTAIFAADLPPAGKIGKTAGERAVSHLGARKMPTARVPVIFDPRESNTLLGHLAGAISGASVARGTSFLKDYLGKRIFSEKINVIDDPFRTRGFRSRLFDAEGLSPARRTIIDRGVLTTWFMDLRSARQLGLKSTAHASRGPGSIPSPSPSNLYIEPCCLSPAELIHDIQQGFYVTELMGSGVNGVTGDYSRAARGFWIENGQITFPVNEMTIAGNLKDMFLNLTAANDLVFRYGIDAPTLRVEGMTVAGV